MQLCNQMAGQECEAARIEHQIHRLRSMLADAWRSGCPAWFIHRVEQLLQQRWQKLEESTDLLHRPMPE